MRVFVTGASGWIGSAAVDELLLAGHEVAGLARSSTSAAALEAKGVQVRQGDLDDLNCLRAGAESSDAVLHLANKHDFANPALSNAAERAAVQTICDTLAGSDRPFLFAAGVAALAKDRPANENDPSPFSGADAPRGGAENLALGYLDHGVRAASLRFAPTVHGTGDHGFISAIAAVALQTGVSGYPGDGTNRWAAVHRSDAGRLVALALGEAVSGSGLPGGRLHAVAEEGIPSREIAEAIGQELNLPVKPIAVEDVPGHFGWIGAFFGMEMSASSALTRTILDWTPTGPTLIHDIAAGAYHHLLTVMK